MKQYQVITAVLYNNNKDRTSFDFKKCSINKYSDTEMNLNKLDDKELANVKTEMDGDFRRNQIAKDDADFQYDILKDYGEPVLENDWDKSDNGFDELENQSVLRQKHSNEIGKTILVPLVNSQVLTDEQEIISEEFEICDEEDDEYLGKFVDNARATAHLNERIDIDEYSDDFGQGETDSENDF